MTKLTFRDVPSTMDDYDVFLFDLWGVVVEGNKIYPGVVDNINKIIKQQKKVFFVTNAPRSRASLFNKINKIWGINTTEEMVFSSGEVAINMILESDKRFGIKTPVVYHLGQDDNDLLNELQTPITTNIDEANIFLLTLHRDAEKNLNLDEFDDLFKTVVKRNIITICANPDLGIMQQGVQRYCSGYFAEKIKQFGGKVIYSGKPHLEIYHTVLNQLPGVPLNRILMIGDTFFTDILGANNLGIDSALVLTGNTTKFHNQHLTIEKKLQHLQIAATEQGVIPNFVIKLTTN
ncbi:TIGR01459 family HAD-type hydrolase [Rickettsia endosymbiont of Oedothorax gibbosus]|uniref:TIGR01459 family HAD-type hydrolase n=1 Tax=Rickettsia endosymbiont of Oedothorax gibbosus TaxID=931099 RepID=UPI00202566DC|nr:TIGR01459 family HAD-type hydrolase [Rickettsia endosymbiont of Oedothorax gibbosus]